MKNFRIPRRTFLQGSGVSILLPYLDIMMPTKAHAADAFAPKRFAAIVLNGSIYGQGYDGTKNNATRYNNSDANESGGQRAWLPAATGALPATLPLYHQGLNAYKQKLTLISNLTSLPGDTGTQHSLATASLLTAGWDSIAEAQQKWPGTNIRKSDAPANSVDQAIAELLGMNSTLVLHGSTSGSSADGKESNGGYLGAVSYNSKLGGTRIVPKSKDPQALFNSLFGNCTTSGGNAPAPALTLGQQNQGKVLDRVMASINDIKGKLGQEDKHRLDNYLTYISELEDKITQPPPPPSDWCPADLETMGQSWYNNVSLLVDIIAYALATDTKPIATLMPSVEPITKSVTVTNQVAKIGNYVGIGGQVVGMPVATDLHIDVIHKARKNNSTSGNVEYIEGYLAYSKMMMTFVERLVTKMESFPNDPNGKKPLDNSVVLVTSPHSDGNQHLTQNIPMLLLGGGELGFKKGEHIALPKWTDIGHFHYTVMKQMGLNVTSFNGHSNLLTSLIAS